MESLQDLKDIKDVQLMVDTFYETIRKDDLLADIFILISRYLKIWPLKIV